MAKSKLREFLLMDDCAERDQLQKDYGMVIGVPKYSRRLPQGKSIKFPPSPHKEDWNKLEDVITKEHELFCLKNGIGFWHTKVKGEPHTDKNGDLKRKGAANPGFFDMILLLPASKVLFLELKRGSGGVVSAHQDSQHKYAIAHGGYALVSNSVKVTQQFLRDKKLIS